MRLIDADAAIDTLKELIANGTNKGMVFGEDAVHRIEMLPSVQSDTTTHDSIPAETGKNDGDRTSGDFISKQASIDELHGKDPSQIWDTADIEVWLNTLPSIQPERPKGKWIHQAKFSRVECDQCGKVFRNTFAPKNFCPNCGADMRGETEWK